MTDKRTTCPACGGYGFHVHYVSHDMATDACEPEMEGQEMREPCEQCRGDGWILEEVEEE